MKFWPISHLRQQRSDVLEARQLARDLANRIAQQDKELVLLRHQLSQARDLIKQAHFHNPKTGRIGKKGILPDALRAK